MDNNERRIRKDARLRTDLIEAWNNVLKQSGSLMDSQGFYVTIPSNVFERFNKEFNICFVEEEDDAEFQSWKDGYK